MRLVERLGTTIAAVATAPGSVIGIIRVSGPEALTLLRQICRGPLPRPRQAVVRRIDSGDGTAPEQAVVLYFAAPASYTGEDLVELHLHGVGVATEAIYMRLFSLGALPALPGEFSFRAVVNGKISLAQAVALPALINAQNRFQSAFAKRAAFLHHFDRAMEPLLARWDEVETLAVAVVDFPDQTAEHLPAEKVQTLCRDTETVISLLIEQTNRFERLSHAQVVIAGRPNVGKSSLFNRLLGRERALVAAEPGTTRDYLTAPLPLPKLGLTVELCDTAGIRETPEPIEEAGVSRTLALTEVSTHTIFVFDGATGPTKEDEEILRRLVPRRPLVVAAKSDLGRHPQAELLAPDLFVSAHTGEGIADLTRLLEERLAAETPDPATPLLFHHEQKRTAAAILASCTACHTALAADDAVLIAAAVSRTRRLLRELAGKADDLSVYDRIFASFCLGK